MTGFFTDRLLPGRTRGACWGVRISVPRPGRGGRPFCALSSGGSGVEYQIRNDAGVGRRRERGRRCARRDPVGRDGDRPTAACAASPCGRVGQFATSDMSVLLRTLL